MRGNLADLAATGLASEPTLRKWILSQPDQDWIIKRGSNGDAYEIDIPAAIAAWKAEEERKTEEARQRANDLRQLGFDLLGDQIAPTSQGVSVVERRQLLEEELVAIKLAEKRRQLVPRAAVEATIGDVLVRFRQRGTTFASRLAKRIDLTRDQITAIDKLALQDQQALADMMENWGKDLGDEGDDRDDPSAPLVDPAIPDGG